MRKLQAWGGAAALLAALLLGGCARQDTVTATPEQAATPTPEVTAESTPEPAVGLSTNPLTGLDDADYTGKRPVAVMLRTLDGAQPQWGIASADVLIEGVTEGNTAGLMALFADVDRISKVGPVGPGRDLFLQAALPLNAMPVSIDKNVYAANLLNTLTYQDLDGYHVGKTAFAFDQGRQDAGYREENCWYTTGELIRSGAASYGTALEGSNTPLFRFGAREEVAPENRSGMSLTVTFSKSDSEQLNYNTGTGLYEKLNADGSPMTDADNGQQAAFTNVFVLYASSGIKDDGYTRQYDMTGGTGLYLHGGAWEQISWSKEDATGPFSLTAADGTPLTVAPGKSFIAIWGGYYGQALRLTAADGSEQTLPEKPALPARGAPAEAHTQSDLVHIGKGYAVALPRQQIGVRPETGQRIGSVGAVQPHGQLHRQLVPGQKLHDPTQSRQLPEGGGDLHSPLGGDALDGAQPLRLLLDNSQRLAAEPLHQPLRRGGADALDDAGGEVADEFLLRLRHQTLHRLGGELLTVGGVADPQAVGGELFTGGHAGDTSHHRHQLALLRQQAQHRIAVLLILEDHVLDGSLHRAALTHSSFLTSDNFPIPPPGKAAPGCIAASGSAPDAGPSHPTRSPPAGWGSLLSHAAPWSGAEPAPAWPRPPGPAAPVRPPPPGYGGAAVSPPAARGWCSRPPPPKRQ